MLMVHKRGILVNFIHVTYLVHILHLKIARKWHSWSDFVINDVLFIRSKNEEIISSFFITCRVIRTNTCQGITSRNYRLGLSLMIIIIIGIHLGTTPNAITSGRLITRIQNWSACPGHFESKIGFFWQFSICIPLRNRLIWLPSS